MNSTNSYIHRKQPSRNIQTPNFPSNKSIQTSRCQECKNVACPATTRNLSGVEPKIPKRQEEHPIAGSKKEINAEEKRLRDRRETWKAAKRTQQQELYFVAGVFWSPNGKNRYSHAGRYLAARPHHDPSALLMLDGRLLWNGVSRCLRVTKPRVPTALCHNNFLAAHRLSYSTMDVCMVNAWNATNRDINR